MARRAYYGGVRKRQKLLRRKANIERRVAQLERDFEAANSLEAELRIQAATHKQNIYYQRVLRRLES